jgi:HK97 gp10 family phage protein
MSVSFRVTGIAETILTLKSIETAALAKAALATEKAAYQIEQVAMNLAPVDTGFLKSSIQLERTGPFGFDVAGHTNYQVFVEFGTSRMAPRAHMYPALDIAAADYVRALQSLI